MGSDEAYDALHWDIALFLNKNEDIGPAIRSKLFGVLSNSQKNACLRVELAAVVDWGEPLNFVKACYFLEEDGPLATECYEAIERIRSGLHTEHIPNGRAVTQAKLLLILLMKHGYYTLCSTRSILL